MHSDRLSPRAERQSPDDDFDTKIFFQSLHTEHSRQDLKVLWPMAAPANPLRIYVITGAVAAITATGAWYGAGIKTRQEYKQVRMWPWHRTSSTYVLTRLTGSQGSPRGYACRTHRANGDGESTTPDTARGTAGQDRPPGCETNTKCYRTGCIVTGRLRA